MRTVTVAMGGALAMVLVSTDAFAAEQGDSGLKWGGDFRSRVTLLDEIPMAGGDEINQLFNRNRTRIWTEYEITPDVRFHARLMNEFFWSDRGRDYGDMQEDREPLSEVLPDLLYVDIDNLADGNMHLRLGRQEMIYGNGRIMLNGTPRDGSRTLFVNAAKLSLDLYPDHQVDLFAIYNEDEDSLTINSQSSLDLIEHDEMAVGFYGQSQVPEQWPFEYYWIYKHEDRDSDSADFQTIGGRVFPTFGDWSLNLELAIQQGEKGDQDIASEMIDASLTYRPQLAGNLEPALSGGYYYLSGNDADSDEREDWFPVFSRWPQLSELYLYSFVGTDHGVGGWSNLHAPFIGADIGLGGKTNLELRYHLLLADEKDGEGDGDERGGLTTINLAMQFTEDLETHLRLEHLAVGDYYPDDAEDAWFARAHLQYSF
ncbi:alginate export family protein [Halorhodospira halochloris]|uniref:alginate export family protein n=1 Tax=Halorhodospira halochloris TaxID=1052 RepID=UPI001EE7A44C|nr:alginate export family protein [Halorhodospira halochloris]MCG5549442.1 alginate export family protein [Halorhodospira halochloris]